MFLFFICIVAAVTVIQASGLADPLGAAPDPGLDKAEKRAGNLSNVDAGRAGGSSSFIGGTIAAGGKVTTVLEILFVFPLVLNRMGLPMGWAVAIGGPMEVVVGWFVISIIRGMQLWS